MKSVLISIQPKWVEKIANGEKTIEVRKTAPKEVPFRVYVYNTKGAVKELCVDEDGQYWRLTKCKVIGEFICDNVITVDCDSIAPFNPKTNEYIEEETCLNRTEFIRYTNVKKALGWHISDLKIYDKPKELSEFYYCCKEMKANEPRAGKYVSLSCYACRHNALKRTEDYSEYNNMLGYICKRNITRPPSNWCYVEEL